VKSDYTHYLFLSSLAGCELSRRLASIQTCQMYGAGDGDRTRDIQLGKLALSLTYCKIVPCFPRNTPYKGKKHGVE
jgi:hypothetical protein